MEKIEHRAVIKFLFLEGVAPKEIHERMLKVYNDCSPTIRTVERWVAEFKRGRTSIEDDPREGRPKSASTPEIIAKIQDMVLEDRRLTERDLVEALHISLGSVSHILSEILGFRKLCAQWVPHSLTMEQKHIRMRLSQQHLERFKKDEMDFVRRFITMDETWVYHHDPESKQEATAVEAYFADLPDSHFRDGIHRLEDRWSKCINVQGDYTE